MNCEHFQQRMQSRLDDRSALDDDPQMIEHSLECVDCYAQLNVWRSIELAIGSPVVDQTSIQPSTNRNRAGIMAAVAASALIALSFVGRDRSEVVAPLVLAPLVSANTTQPRTEEIDLVTTLQAIQWWETVRKTDWIGRTIPAVRSVQDGVAPLGLSLIQAVTILTMGDPSKTS